MQALTLCVMCLIAAVVEVSSESTKEILDSVTAGVTAGQAITHSLNDASFSDTMKTLSSNIGAFLGSIGPMVYLVLTLIPNSPYDEELKRKQRDFTKMNDELAEACKGYERNAMYAKTTTRDDMSHYVAIFDLLNTLNATLYGKTYYKHYFALRYADTYRASVNALYEKVMYNGQFPKNMIDLVMASYSNPKDVWNIMKGVTMTIIHGVEGEFASDTVYNYVPDKSTWETKLKNMFSRLENTIRK